MFSLGSSVVAWCLKKQLITALSSTEEEYISLTMDACEAVWMRWLLEDLNEKEKDSSVIYCDNQSALSIAKNPIPHVRTKHIDTRFHFIHDLMRDEIIQVKYCSTETQLADIFTKIMPRVKFDSFCERLGVGEFSNQGEHVGVRT